MICDKEQENSPTYLGQQRLSGEDRIMRKTVNSKTSQGLGHLSLCVKVFMVPARSTLDFIFFTCFAARLLLLHLLSDPASSLIKAFTMSQALLCFTDFNLVLPNISPLRYKVQLLHFVGEEIEAYEDLLTCQDRTVCKW